jgi:hypothetical protein
MSPAASLRCRRPSLDPPGGTVVDSLKGGQGVGQVCGRHVRREVVEPVRWEVVEPRGGPQHRGHRDDRDRRGHSVPPPQRPLGWDASRPLPGNPGTTEGRWEAQKARWQEEAAQGRKDYPGARSLRRTGCGERKSCGERKRRSWSGESKSSGSKRQSGVRLRRHR